MEEKKQFTEEEIQKALETDLTAIAFRARIQRVENMLGRQYSQRIEMEYLDYIREKYRQK